MPRCTRGPRRTTAGDRRADRDRRNNVRRQHRHRRRSPLTEIQSSVVEREYDASAIQVLEGLDAVRKRPGMYIGSTGERGLHHLVYEVVDNAVDEALAGFCDKIVVTLLADGGVRVVDNGRGIPVDIVESEGKPAVTVVLTVLHAGGKFGGGGYKVSGGLHGVGVSVVNALSSRLQVDVHKNGKIYTQSFTIGVPDADLAEIGTSDSTGTTITFWPSPDVFETTVYSYETLSTRFREYAFLNKGLELVIRDERPDHTEDGNPVEQSFKYDDGLVDYVKYLTGIRETVHRDVIAFEAAHRARTSLSLEVAMQWSGSFQESVHTFANAINTHEGGTHEEGFRAALTSLVNSFGEDQGMIKKKEDRLTGDDIREGLTAIISVKLGNPQFEGQTKTKLGNTEVKGFVQRVVNDRLGAWFEQNPQEGSEIIRKATAAASARIAARKARDLARNRKGLLGGGGLPGKLSDCQSTNPEECEVYIVEGDSAGGSAKGGRDPEVPGDPADPGQDPERREGPDRPGPAEQRGPGDHLRTRHRHPRGLRRGEAPVPQDRDHGRRRRRRPAHPDPAAHPAVPVHAAADRARSRVRRAAAAVQAPLEQPAARAGLHRAGEGRPAAGRRRGRQEAAEGERDPALQGSG